MMTLGAIFLQLFVLFADIADDRAQAQRSRRRSFWRVLSAAVGGSRTIAWVCLLGLIWLMWGVRHGESVRAEVNMVCWVAATMLAVKGSWSGPALLVFDLSIDVLERIFARWRRNEAVESPTTWLKINGVPLEHVHYLQDTFQAEVDFDVRPPMVRALGAKRIGDREYTTVLWHEIGHVLDYSVICGGRRLCFGRNGFRSGRHSRRLLNQLRAAYPVLDEHRGTEVSVTHRGRTFSQYQVAVADVHPHVRAKLLRKLRNKQAAWDAYATSPDELFAEALALRMTYPEVLRSRAPQLFEELGQILRRNGIVPNQSRESDSATAARKRTHVIKRIRVCLGAGFPAQASLDAKEFIRRRSLKIVRESLDGAGAQFEVRGWQWGLLRWQAPSRIVLSQDGNMTPAEVNWALWHEVGHYLDFFERKFGFDRSHIEVGFGRPGAHAISARYSKRLQPLLEAAAKTIIDLHPIEVALAFDGPKKHFAGQQPLRLQELPPKIAEQVQDELDRGIRFTRQPLVELFAEAFAWFMTAPADMRRREPKLAEEMRRIAEAEGAVDSCGREHLPSDISAKNKSP